MIEKKPKVTVVIPNYNHARFLTQRIDSVLNQTYQDFEILYLDDASTDSSAEVIARYQSNDKIRVIENKQNSGSAFKQWNKGVREARGEYIWIAEADDYADYNLLQRLVEKLDQHSKVGLAYCQSWSVDENNKIVSFCGDWIAYLDNNKWKTDYINSGKQECRDFMILYNTIPNASAVLFRRSIYQEAGFASEEMKFCGDWLLWNRMLLLGDIAFVSEPLNYFRIHTTSLGSKSYNNGINAEESYLICEELLNKVNITLRQRRRVFSELLERWLPFIISKDGKIPLSRNIRIYKIASRIDRRFKSRFLKKIVILIFSKIVSFCRNHFTAHLRISF